MADKDAKSVEINIYTDITAVVDILKEIGAALKAAVDIPKEERDGYRKALGRTYSMLDTTLNMVILRLGDILFDYRDDEHFLKQVANLDNWKKWRTIERQFSICSNLIALQSELRKKINRNFGRSCL